MHAHLRHTRCTCLKRTPSLKPAISSYHTYMRCTLTQFRFVSCLCSKGNEKVIEPTVQVFLEEFLFRTQSIVYCITVLVSISHTWTRISQLFAGGGKNVLCHKCMPPLQRCANRTNMYARAKNETYGSTRRLNFLCARTCFTHSKLLHAYRCNPVVHTS